MAPVPRDYYADLGVSPSATLEQIRAAHRKLAMTCHPDKLGCDASKDAGDFRKVKYLFPIANPPFIFISLFFFQVSLLTKRTRNLQIQEAYEVLRDKSSRAKYNRLYRKVFGECFRDTSAQAKYERAQRLYKMVEEYRKARMAEFAARAAFARAQREKQQRQQQQEEPAERNEPQQPAPEAATTTIHELRWNPQLLRRRLAEIHAARVRMLDQVERHTRGPGREERPAQT